ncbi:MAG: hypothetical protein U0002_08520 [Thermoanaerobaculia bacterium]
MSFQFKPPTGKAFEEFSTVEEVFSRQGLAELTRSVKLVERARTEVRELDSWKTATCSKPSVVTLDVDGKKLPEWNPLVQVLLANERCAATYSDGSVVELTGFESSAIATRDAAGYQPVNAERLPFRLRDLEMVTAASWKSRVELLVNRQLKQGESFQAAGPVAFWAGLALPVAQQTRFKDWADCPVGERHCLELEVTLASYPDTLDSDRPKLEGSVAAAFGVPKRDVYIRSLEASGKATRLVDPASLVEYRHQGEVKLTVQFQLAGFPEATVELTRTETRSLQPLGKAADSGER